jgi:hypothetical protein
LPSPLAASPTSIAHLSLWLSAPKKKPFSRGLPDQENRQETTATQLHQTTSNTLAAQSLLFLREYKKKKNSPSFLSFHCTNRPPTISLISLPRIAH